MKKPKAARPSSFKLASNVIVINEQWIKFVEWKNLEAIYLLATIFYQEIKNMFNVGLFSSAFLLI